MTEADWIRGARLALPGQAVLTGITAIQQLGLDFGPRRPLHFVVEGELHLDLPAIFLHRTILLPPACAGTATPAAAFVSYCTAARLIDAIAVGDWLLHHRHMDLDELEELARLQPWRDGAAEAAYVVQFLESRAASVKESEARCLLVFAGLPAPEVNARVVGIEGVVVIGDLSYAVYRTVVEYEGSQHQDDRAQYVSDIDRYALMRRADHRYVQVTREKLRVPRAYVREVHAAIVAGGYTGPAPDFGETWEQLFRPVREVLGGRRRSVG